MKSTKNEYLGKPFYSPPQFEYPFELQRLQIQVKQAKLKKYDEASPTPTTWSLKNTPLLGKSRWHHKEDLATSKHSTKKKVFRK